MLGNLVYRRKRKKPGGKNNMKLINIFNKYCNRNQCTCWIDKLGKTNWGSCCTEHDQDIIHARTKSSFEADRKLFKCVWTKPGILSKIIAPIMFIFVTPMSYCFWTFYYKNGEK